MRKILQFLGIYDYYNTRFRQSGNTLQILKSSHPLTQELHPKETKLCVKMFTSGFSFM